MPYFLAVDAGGTKTEFVLADAHQELARVRTGTIKRLRASEETTGINLSDALLALESQSGVLMKSVSCCCIGTSGETVPLVVDWLRSAFSNRVGGQLVILGDVEIALDAYFHGRRGILVLAGTGSNVAGRAGDGTILTTGGWGPAMADQGSGHSLGLQALRRGFLAIDEQRPTPLLTLAMEHWKLSSLNALIEYANSDPAPNFSTLAPLVVSSAQAGDLIAQEILLDGGKQLAYLVCLLIERVRAREGSAFPPPEIAMAGSVLVQIAPVRQALENALRLSYPQIVFLDHTAEPVGGALWRARASL